MRDDARRFRTRVRSLLLPAIVVLGVGAGAPSPPSAGPLDELRRGAEAIDLPRGVARDVMLVDGLIVTWIVFVQAGPILESLPGDVAEDLNAHHALAAWSDSINERLVAHTAEVMPQHDPHFNPETDVVVIVSGSAAAAPRPFDRMYRGHRRTGVRAPDRELSGETEITIDVVPRRLLWTPRETNDGIVVLRNAGTRRVPIPTHRFTGVTITDETGVPPRPLPTGRTLCLMPPTPQYDFLLPGETLERPFSIHTDPGSASLMGRYRVPKGRWLLGHTDLFHEVNAITRVAPVLIEVRAAAGHLAGPGPAEAGAPSLP